MDSKSEAKFIENKSVINIITSNDPEYILNGEKIDENAVEKLKISTIVISIILTILSVLLTTFILGILLSTKYGMETVGFEWIINVPLSLLFSLVLCLTILILRGARMESRMINFVIVGFIITVIFHLFSYLILPKLI